MKRLAPLVLAALLALPATAAHAAPTRVRCEQVAKQAADRVARPGTSAWHNAYANAWAACAARQRLVIPEANRSPFLPTTNRPVLPVWWVA